jgi:rod shape-determining protein MreC
MAIPDIRQRVGYLFLAVAVGHIILISAQVNSRSGVPLLEVVIFGIYAQVQRVTSGTVNAVRGVWTEYFALHGVRVENEALRRQVADLQVRLQRQQALAEQSARLRQLLDLRERSNMVTRSAEIIGGSPAPDFRTVTIDRGLRDGLRADMAVIAPSGVVGRVVLPASHAAKVQLIIDRNAAAAAVVARSRAQGIVMGTGDDLLRLEYLSASSDVKTGDVVVTSGIDGIYPKGFVIGRVESVERAGGAYKRVLVRPAVDLSGLEEVLVVLTPPTASAGEGTE